MLIKIIILITKQKRWKLPNIVAMFSKDMLQWQIELMAEIKSEEIKL